MDYSFQANGSFAVPLLYNGRGDFSTPRRNVSCKYFSCSWLCRLVFCQPQNFIVYGFAARLAEMDGHAVVGGADTLGEAARLAWGLLLWNGGCLHYIGSFLLGGGFDMVVVGYHLFLWGVCPVDFEKPMPGALALICFPAFVPVTFLRPALLDIRRVFSVAAPASRPGVFHAKVAVPRYLTGCGIQFYAVLYFSRLQILSHKRLIKSRFCAIIQVTV